MKKLKYTLSIVLIASCTICSEIQAQTSITYGQTISSSISTPGEVDAYTFTGNTNDRVTIRAAANWSHRPQLELYSPGGILLSRVNDYNSTRIEATTLTANGTYTILMMDDDGLHTGNYDLSLQRTFNPGLSIPISYGQTLNDTILLRSEMNAYTFTGNTNDRVTIRAAANWSHRPQLELYSPGGILLSRVNDYNSTRIEATTLTANGTYTILMMDDDGLHTGNYALSLQRTFNPGLSIPISYGQTLNDTILLRSEMNAYTFIGNTNDIVTINAAANWSHRPQLELYSPGGILLSRVNDYNSTQITALTLTVNGQHTILMMDDDGLETGNYLVSINGIPILPVSLDLKVLTEGLYDQGLNRMARKDTMKVYLRNITPPYSLVDSAQSIIDSITFSGLFNFHIASSGTYYLVVKHFNSIETWSKSGGELLVRDTSVNNYDFTTSKTQAFGNNQKQLDEFPVRFGIYSGDVNQDGIIDGSDLSLVENDLVISLSGYVPSDVTGDNFVDASDISIVENNSFIGVSVIVP